MGRRRVGWRRPSNRQIDFLGWLLFTASAICFLVAAWGDPWAVAGAIFFLVACLAFMVPFFRR